MEPEPFALGDEVQITCSGEIGHGALVAGAEAPAEAAAQDDYEARIQFTPCVEPRSFEAGSPFWPCDI